MKITYLVPEWQNIGDKVIWIGAKGHYERIYGKCQHEVRFLSILPTEPFDTDIFVVCGTPWIWDQCTFSGKYHALEQYLAMARCNRKEAIGIGSCYKIPCLGRKWIAFQHLEVCDKLASVWSKFDYVSVRDWYAEYILSALGINCYLTKCPSYNAVDYLKILPKEEKYKTLVIYDLIRGIGGETILPESEVVWKGMLQDIVDKYEIDRFLALNSFEVEMAEELGVEATLFAENDIRGSSQETVINLFKFLSESKLVISPRVHIAIPSICLNKNTLFVPIDTRSLTVVGAKSIYEESPELERLQL